MGTGRWRGRWAMVASGIGGHSEKEAMQTLIPVSSGPMVGRWKRIGQLGQEECAARHLFLLVGEGLMSALWVHTFVCVCLCVCVWWRDLGAWISHRDDLTLSNSVLTHPQRNEWGGICRRRKPGISQQYVITPIVRAQLYSFERTQSAIV